MSTKVLKLQFDLQKVWIFQYFCGHVRTLDEIVLSTGYEFFLLLGYFNVNLCELSEQEYSYSLPILNRHFLQRKRRINI